ncbi:GDSL esterase/lipase At4g16230-like isoform X2 [Cajanus cajan]|uniref:GDSL esterase/lipase At4g16230-like isoform X2 n=1 Tax=Cajanus cajan TaxID=3821 RepID=UPI0010FB9261|nr:GDSL esterase/lipase At4g16230-like isoform X2 [Cajanus cajan]
MFLIKVLCTFSQLVVTDKKRKQRNLLPNFIVLIICSIYFPMGIKLNRPIIVQILFLVFIVLSLFRITTSDNLRPANFVFGDSLVDVGNNNYIASLSRANYVPFGIDFGRPTGRFTNGRTIVDIIGQEMGIDFTPPYLAPTTAGPVILNGVNYASGAGGILNLTGKLFGDRINFDAQLDNFANTRQDIISYIGLPATLNLFRRSIFSVTMGSNDFINNYLAPAVIILEQELASPELFVTTLVSRFREQLIRLFNMGARKITVTNVGPIGCIPSQRDTNPAADVYHILEDLLNNYAAYGFEDPSSGCCRVLLGGRFGGLIPCGPTSTVCSDRSKYVFWDPWHPTDAANVIIAKRLLDGDHNDIFPVNVRKLIQY